MPNSVPSRRRLLQPSRRRRQTQSRIASLRSNRQTQSRIASLRSNRQTIFNSRRTRELEERRQNIETILLRNLLEVIHYFKTVYTHRLRQLGVQQDKIDDEINFCCNPVEITMLLRFASILKIKFPEMSNRDVCISIVYVYYSLILLEQTTEYMNGNIYRLYADDRHSVDNLILQITIGEIPMQINGIRRDIAREIRRFLFGFW